MTDKYIFPS